MLRLDLRLVEVFQRHTKKVRHHTFHRLGNFGLDFGLLATGGVIAALPPVAIAFIFQRHIVAGLTSGGVKG